MATPPSQFSSCILHGTVSAGDIGGGLTATSLATTLIRWNYATAGPSEVITQSKEKAEVIPPAKGTHSIVICFPGDRLPHALRSEAEAKLSEAEASEVEQFVSDRAVGCSPSPGSLRHVLDLQEPGGIATMLAAAFPNTTPPSKPMHTRHYLVAFADTITSEGYSVYSQLFDEGVLKATGEPLKGVYSAGSQGKSLDAIGGVLRHLFQGQQLPIITSFDLVGFSKGCVALNQLVADIGEGSCRGAQPHVEAGQSYSWNLGVHYVDGGLNSAGAFICDRPLLEKFRDAFINHPAPNTCLFPALNSSFHYASCAEVSYQIYSTPRQRMDPHRPYLDYERRMMATHLCGVKRVVPGAPMASPLTAMPSYFTVKEKGVGGAPDSRDWATTELPVNEARPVRFRVRVLEDIPPVARSKSFTDNISPVMEGLKQHMLAMARFGQRNN